jgi:hypothetical protein
MRSAGNAESAESGAGAIPRPHAGWIWMTMAAIGKIAYWFNIQRMTRCEASEAYIH